MGVVALVLIAVRCSAARAPHGIGSRKSSSMDSTSVSSFTVYFSGWGTWSQSSPSDKSSLSAPITSWNIYSSVICPATATPSRWISNQWVTLPRRNRKGCHLLWLWLHQLFRLTVPFCNISVIPMTMRLASAGWPLHRLGEALMLGRVNGAH